MSIQFVGLDAGLQREADAQAIAYASKVNEYRVLDSA
jgi:hypothetical protein